MKKILAVLLCFVFVLGVTGCNRVDPREREIIILLNENKFNDAIIKAKQLYEGEEKKLEEVLEFIQSSKTNREKEKQMIEDAYPSKKLEIQPDDSYSIKGDYAYVTGKVKNISNSEILYFEVVVDLLDDNGNIIHSEYTNDGLTLKPNATREFKIMFKNNEDYKKYKLSIGKVN